MTRGKGTAVRPVVLALSILLCISCDRDHRRPENVRDDLCSSSWWRDVARAEVVQRAQAYGVSLNAVCDDEGNTPLHLALSAEGILSEYAFYAIAEIVRSGADLFAVNTAGESSVILAEARFQRMLARWDRDMEKLCEGVDVMDQVVQRERWENSLYYLVRTDSGLETLEEVRERTNARRERLPGCAR